MGPPPHALGRGEAVLRLCVQVDLPRVLSRESHVEVWALVLDSDMQLLATLTPASPPLPYLRLQRHSVSDGAASSSGPSEVVLAKIVPSRLPPRALMVALAVRRGEVCSPPSAHAMAAQAADALVGMRHLRTKAGKGLRCTLTTTPQKTPGPETRTEQDTEVRHCTPRDLSAIRCRTSGAYLFCGTHRANVHVCRVC